MPRRLAPALLLGMLGATPAIAAGGDGDVDRIAPAAGRLLVIDHERAGPTVRAPSGAARPGPTWRFAFDRPRKSGLAASPERYRTLVLATEIRLGLPRGLLDALVIEESGYSTVAVSPRGAVGLAQLMPATARSLGVTDPFDPLRNIDAAGRYLSALLVRFGSVTLALAAYNAGPRAVARAGGLPPFAETRRYVARVLARWAAFPPGGTSPRTDARRRSGSVVRG